MADEGVRQVDMIHMMYLELFANKQSLIYQWHHHCIEEPLAPRFCFQDKIADEQTVILKT